MLMTGDMMTLCSMVMVWGGGSNDRPLLWVAGRRRDCRGQPQSRLTSFLRTGDNVV